MYQNQNMNPNMNPNPQYAYGGMPYGTAPGQFYNPSPDPTVIGGYTYGGRPAIKATQPITPELMKFLHQHRLAGHGSQKSLPTIWKQDISRFQLRQDGGTSQLSQK